MSVVAIWDGGRGSMYRLAVAPVRRRARIAAWLLRAAEVRLMERGAVRFSVLGQKKGPAAEFWSKMGYSEDIRVSRFARTRVSVIHE